MLNWNKTYEVNDITEMDFEDPKQLVRHETILNFKVGYSDANNITVHSTDFAKVSTLRK